MEITVPMPGTPLKNTTPAPKNINTIDTYGDQYAKFIEIASHDLKAPLRKLGVLTDRLVARFTTTAGEEVAQYTDRIHACIAEMQSLIDGFTELAGAVRTNMIVTDCNLEAIVNNLLREFAGPIRDKQAEITTSGLPQLKGDKAQLKMLFREILENAFKFSREGTPLRVEFRGTLATTDEKTRSGLPADSVYYKILICDNGIGFDAGEADHIFEPLTRLHGKSSFRGNGLGLSLVRRIAGNHNGVVFAEGTNEGAVINLLLPQNQE